MENLQSLIVPIARMALRIAGAVALVVGAFLLAWWWF